MDCYQHIAPIKLLFVATSILAMFGSFAKCADVEPALAELNCQYDLMTGGRVCDCNYRDEVLDLSEANNCCRKRAQYSMHCLCVFGSCLR